MADVAGVEHECRLLRQAIDLRDGLFERAERVGIGGLVEPDMAVADLQERKAAALRGLRLAHNSERVRDAAGNGPEHARATPGHAFQDLASVEAVSLVDLTHLRISFEPRSPKPIRPCGLRAEDWPKPRFIPAFQPKFLRQSAVMGAVMALLRGLFWRRPGARSPRFGFCLKPLSRLGL